MEDQPIYIKPAFASSKRSRGTQDLIFVCLVLAAILLVYGVQDYLSIRADLADKAELERLLAAHQERIADQQDNLLRQRHDIRRFANEINGLKERLITLSRIEDEIRTVSEVVNGDSPETLIGVGGSTPEATNPHIDLSLKHDYLVSEMTDQIDQLDAMAGDRKNGMTALLGELKEKQKRLDATPTIRPTQGRITSAYGKRVSPFTGRVEMHEGLDIAAKYGTQILAAANGKIAFAGYKGFYGKMIVIDHGYGMETRYAHISKFLKKAGDRVKKGEPIAMVGNTGRSTGAHLHYEVSLNGETVDPIRYILR